MRLLVICPHFEPDTAPTGVVMSAITNELVRAGHDVHVVTSLPWYEHHRVDPAWRGRPVRRQRTSWGAITRVHPFPTDKRNIPARGLAFAGFTAMSTLAATAQRIRPDGVLAMSPPITLGLAGWVAARLRRVPFVFNIQDVFPDVAIEVGAISSPRLIAVARRLERFTYRRADAVTVLSDDLRANVMTKIGARSSTQVRVIPNFADVEGIRPESRHTAYRREFDLGNRTVVMYAGNVGFSQPLELIVDAARAYQHRDDLVFVINGQGSARPGLEAAAARLPNIRFVDFQPAERLAEVLASADVHVIALRPGLGRASVPSKMYSILAAARPIVASIDAETEVSRVIERSGSGIAVAPSALDPFLDALAELVDDPSRRTTMGELGRTFVETWMSPQGVANAYVDLFADLDGRVPPA